MLAAGHAQGALTVAGAEHAEAVLFQVIARQAHDLGFVVHDKDQFVHGSSLPVV
jgi:hypothetical protein